jgi:hypothetical protein
MRVALWMVVGVVVVLVGFTMAVHGLVMKTSPGLSDNFYSANDGLNDFKMKMAQIMGSADQGKDNGVNVEDQGGANDLNANVSGVNLSEVDRSAYNQSAHDLSTVNPIPFESPAPNTGAFNSSESEPQLASSQNSSSVNQSRENRTLGIQPGKNSTSKTASDSGRSMLSQSDSISPSGIHLDNQASFNGDWSIQAGKQGFGNSGINDRMALSGDFNVHKSVSFKG